MQHSLKAYLLSLLLFTSFLSLAQNQTTNCGFDEHLQKPSNLAKIEAYEMLMNQDKLGQNSYTNKSGQILTIPVVLDISISIFQ